MQTASALLACALSAVPLAAQGTPISTVDLDELHTEGDVVGLVGNTTSINNLAINNSGIWLLEVDTDNPDTTADGALLTQFGVSLTEGESLAMPTGSSIGSFDSITLNNLSESGWNFFLDGTASNNDDSGIYFNTTLLIQEGSVSSAAGFSAGTVFTGFLETKIADSGHILVMASVDDSAIASTTDRALMEVDVFGGATQTVLFKEGDVLPGQTEAVADFETSPHNFAYNALREVLFIADLAGDTAVDHAVYLDSVLLAQEGSASPVAGRNWSSLASAEVNLNDHGDYVISGSLDGDTSSNLLIELNGAKFRQEGDSVTDNDFASWNLTSFGSGPVMIGNNGNVLWFGDWDNPDTDVDSGLFLNDQLIVQEGVSTVDGVVIDTLRSVQDGYMLSDDGQWFIFRAVLDNGDDVAARVHVGPFVSLGQGLAGAGGVTPQLRGKGSLASGGSFTLDVIGALPGAMNTVVYSLTNLSAPFKGGTLIPAPDFFIGGALIGVDGSRQLNLGLPGGVPSGLDVFLQFWITDPSGFSGFSSTNGLKATTP
ncbi:MAG: hypothetical protein DHS20C15_30760 [Planctomycetota bacterium]|nr:MAG: hypothetical protein DHS20C15_30760 [Planctomycetota bacterium]